MKQQALYLSHSCLRILDAKALHGQPDILDTVALLASSQKTH
jgi:hypothetical protein